MQYWAQLDSFIANWMNGQLAFECGTQLGDCQWWLQDYIVVIQDS